ncbi:MAG: tetratricopeptide repeat protein [Sulfuricellaceae bacterium]|nr:tetratricopeptide repeat protein [Sulfuricellaceae bacterium]
MSASRLVYFITTLAATALFASLPAQADEAQEISRMLKQGQQDKALDRTNSYLVSHPKDAQVRFIKGLILTEQNKTVEAIKLFTSITDDYPELPEPYNNLAVLYASQGQYEKARTALEMAINTHPSYATAHENLGDIYAKMASQSYDKALQLDKNNANAQSKLALVKDIFSKQASPASAKPTSSVAAAKPPVIASIAATKSIAQTEAAKPIAPAPTPIVAPAPVAAKPVQPAAPVQSTVAPVQPEPPAKPSNDGAKANDGEAAVIAAINAWARAWSDKNVSGYLKAYAPEFTPPKGESRKKWEQERKERISKPKAISVSLSDIQVSMVDGTHAKATFKQNYRATALDSNTWKTLVMVKSGGTWLIHEERIGK